MSPTDATNALISFCTPVSCPREHVAAPLDRHQPCPRDPRRRPAAIQYVARTITALLTLRDQVLGPIIAGVRSPQRGRRPAHWTRIDADSKTLRASMQVLFRDLGIETQPAAA
jgi:hypothetical protein